MFLLFIPLLATVTVDVHNELRFGLRRVPTWSFQIIIIWVTYSCCPTYPSPNLECRIGCLRAREKNIVVKSVVSWLPNVRAVQTNSCWLRATNQRAIQRWAVVVPPASNEIDHLKKRKWNTMKWEEFIPRLLEDASNQNDTDYWNLVEECRTMEPTQEVLMRRSMMRNKQKDG